MITATPTDTGPAVEIPHPSPLRASLPKATRPLTPASVALLKLVAAHIVKIYLMEDGSR